MKRFMFVWFIVAIACTIGIGAVFGQDEGFNPDNEAGIMIEEIRERFGDTPRPTEEIILGAVAKNFQNEVHLGNQGAGGVDGEQSQGCGPFLDLLCHTVRTEDGAAACRNFVQIFDKDRDSRSWGSS